MSFKFTLLAAIVVVGSIVAGCRCGGGHCWSKPGYQPAAPTSAASRTYSPVESVSPYQSAPTAAGSGTTYAPSGGSGTTYSQPTYSQPAYSESVPSYNGGSLPTAGGSGTTSFGGSGAR